MSSCFSSELPDSEKLQENADEINSLAAGLATEYNILVAHVREAADQYNYHIKTLLGGVRTKDREILRGNSNHTPQSGKDAEVRTSRVFLIGGIEY